ncbi:nitroreductase family protein [Synoicihabitans lomoniglobus]|uniref:Nitroreductase family protein n=1 Tax=Synoicihabitans lomoniglobus TaxID=2909285 RepID=A0AAF0I487_9BACT|nr:nitroreductase family protein [Opitutaceae bacterium LMO-M01]WED66345.1 nitroreductase family protein [Opitutaceae bacterium LMO-M01]
MAKFSCSLRKPVSQSNQRALLTFYYHKVEKGLALPSPRKEFGALWITGNFLPLLGSYVKDFKIDEVVASSCRALQAYIDIHSRDFEGESVVLDAIEHALQRVNYSEVEAEGGTRAILASSIASASQIDFEAFALARHSIRNFAQRDVERQVVERAVSIARTAPSVCNRQPWRVYGLTDKTKIRSALKFQNGNKGFGEDIRCLLLVTGDLSAMISQHERNEIYIDGGLFSMNLIYALQALGLGTCCLNLCLPYTQEKRLARFYNCPPQLRVIMMIAVGHLPDSLVVACSHKRAVSDLFDWCD